MKLKPFYLLLLPLLLISNGCGGVMDYSIPPMQFDATLNNADGAITVLQPFDKQHMLSDEALEILTQKESHMRRKTIFPNSEGVYSVHFPKHVRHGVLFILPPLGTAMNDYGSYLLIQFPSDSIYGFSFGEKQLEIYKLGKDKKMKRIQTGSPDMPFAVYTRSVEGKEYLEIQN